MSKNLGAHGVLREILTQALAREMSFDGGLADTAVKIQVAQEYAQFIAAYALADPRLAVLELPEVDEGTLGTQKTFDYVGEAGDFARFIVTTRGEVRSFVRMGYWAPDKGDRLEPFVAGFVAAARRAIEAAEQDYPLLARDLRAQVQRLQDEETDR